ncbi:MULTISPECIES: aminoglycoside 6-adenylyltransferase [Exiguobacterium]|uniref:aminoglycoside 6-adenylyltransferase n=1 Tax=Exiguobacterium TaxID=33986 RepID=UPI001BEC985B|nr:MULTISPECIES: aminoglycoside 6-adenylyltransferase [Exiguobacterium]MCT4778359.1 aminoglycoside 6-adenylyltransferase [Exiguobacterium aquaticum]MCT4790398.1 aminoglycoside 6-adenylyltransferase [Exiguobacterium mexicanum]
MTNEQVVEQLTSVAKQREDVRVLILNGSLVNPNVSTDRFQDVDVTCFVEDVDTFIEDRSWMMPLGEVLIMQTPDEVPGKGNYDRFAFLVQFAAGHRVDLTVRPLRDVQATIQADSLSLVLIDKDGIAGRPVPSDDTYRIKPPSRFDYEQCWNEFWWVSLYVVKGIKRGQLLYAYDHVTIMRAMLRQMLSWEVGFETGFTVNAGKAGDALAPYMDAAEWDDYLHTFPTIETTSIEAAHTALVEQFERTSRRVAERAGYSFRAEEARRIRDAFSTLWGSND